MAIMTLTVPNDGGRRHVGSRRQRRDLTTTVTTTMSVSDDDESATAQGSPAHSIPLPEQTREGETIATAAPAQTTADKCLWNDCNIPFSDLQQLVEHIHSRE